MSEPAAAPPNPMPPDAVETVRAALEDTLSTICERKLELSPAEPPTDGEGVSASIAMPGDLEFAFVLRVPRPAAEPLSVLFTGVPLEYGSEMMLDALGELANVLAGPLLARLEVAGYATRISLPSTIQSLTAEPDPALGRLLAGWRADPGCGAVYVTVHAIGGTA